MFLIYVCLAILLAYLFSIQTDKKLVSFGILLWLVAEPVLKTQYTISLSWLPFDFQPSRILILFLIGYFAWGLLTRAPGSAVKPLHTPLFEKLLYIYLLLVLVSLAYNSDALHFKTLFAVPLEIISFIVIYKAAQRYVTERVLAAVFSAIVVMSVVSAAFAIVQFAVDDYFFRVSPDQLRRAFGSHLRATGIFQNEYEFGYFQILATSVLMTKPHRRLLDYAVVGLLVFSVVLTFHRLDYLILLIALISYAMLVPPKRYRIIAMLSVMLVAGILVSTYVIWQTSGARSEVVEQRLKEDTISGRLKQFQVVLDSLRKYPLGLGEYENPEYINLMIRNGLTTSSPDQYGFNQMRPLTVHNGFLAAGMKYGTLAMIVFGLFIMSLLAFCIRHARRGDRASMVPVYAVMIWMLSNVSNSASSFRIYFVLLIALSCGAYMGQLAKRARETSMTTGIPQVVPVAATTITK